jgi:hypothetical protein
VVGVVDRTVMQGELQEEPQGGEEEDDVDNPGQPFEGEEEDGKGNPEDKALPL